jgi:hypothetical protein
MEIKILGNFEKVNFPQFGIKSIDAKIDSGADSGALHCTKVIEEKTPQGKVINFSPFDYPDIKITTDDYYIDDVKSSNGITEKRYFIKTFIVVLGETYQIVLSLADRSTMKWPVLIGSRFLAENKFLVDVNKKTGVSLAKVKAERS